MVYEVLLCNGLLGGFSGRTQFVSVDSVISSAAKIKCGVLWPFFNYICKWYGIPSFVKFILFADDTNLFASHTNLDTLLS